ncbi:MAG: porin family protein [Flavobacteriales bacterium]
MTKLVHAACAFGAILFAAPAFSQGPKVGVKGGLNYTTLAGGDSNEDNGRIGFNAGVFARTAPEAPLGLQVELLYSTKGNHTKYNAFFGLVDQDVDFNLNYIELPVMADLHILDVVDIHLGGYAAYLVSANVTTSGTLGSGSDTLDKSNFKSMDFGIAGGVGFNIGTSAQIGVRYLHGLSDVVDSSDLSSVVGNPQNRCVQVYVGIGIGG